MKNVLPRKRYSLLFLSNFYKYTLLALLFWHSQAAFGQKTGKPSKPFSQTPAPPKPNYAELKNWAALPQRKDAADIAPKGTQDQQSTAKADVFFIHPTTYTGPPNDSFEWNADLINNKLNKQVDKKPIKFQASVFNGSCRVYAPRYRQAHYYAFLTPEKNDKEQALDLAYQDIRSAFVYYLSHYHHQRPIIIAAHSQGTIHAQRLLREFFENKALDSFLVAAYLVGMPVPTDSLPALSPCDSALQTHCFVSWRTYERGHEPHWGQGDFVCHNPISWRMDTTYIPKEKQMGAVLRNFRHPYYHLCDVQVHGEILWVTKPQFPGSKLIHTPNYHVGDYNLFYLDIRKNVEDRVNQWFAEKG